MHTAETEFIPRSARSTSHDSRSVERPRKRPLRVPSATRYSVIGHLTVVGAVLHEVSRLAPTLSSPLPGCSNHISEWFAGRVPPELVAHEPPCTRQECARGTADMWRDEYARRPPQRMIGRQRLRVGDIERRAQPPRAHLGHQ